MFLISLSLNIVALVPVLIVLGRNGRVAEEAWGQLALKGLDAVKPIYLPAKNVNHANPLGRFGYVGAQFMKAATRLNEQWMVRYECLYGANGTAPCVVWPRDRFQRAEFWGEDNRHGVGDASFFDRLASVHEFYGVDSWCVSKVYHALAPTREPRHNFCTKLTAFCNHNSAATHSFFLENTLLGHSHDRSQA